MRGKRCEKRSRTHNHASASRDCGKRSGTLQRTADESEIVHGLRVQTDGFRRTGANGPNGGHRRIIRRSEELCNTKYPEETAPYGAKFCHWSNLRGWVARRHIVFSMT